MEPYYKAWQDSSHRNVACVDCHFEPGWRNELTGKFQALTQLVTYLNGTYGTNPSAQVKDGSCLRSGCHETRLIEGPIEFKRGIKFDHAAHLNKPVRGITLKCTSCHSQIVQGNHMSVTETVCFTCHFKGNVSETKVRDQKFCTFCHNPPEGPIKVGDQEYRHDYYVSIGVACQRCHQDVIRGEGEVSLSRCIQCHPEEDKMGKRHDFEFMHNKHVTEVKIECFDCHDDIKHHLPEKGSPPVTSCKVCHEATHDAPTKLYLGIGGKGMDKPMPAPMYVSQVDCIGCHTEEARFVKGTHPVTSKASIASCVTCHPSGGKEAYDNWRKAIPSMLAKVETRMPKAEARLKAIPDTDPKRAELDAKVADAKYNYDLVVNGDAIHNIRYAEALMDKSAEMLDEVINYKP
jgi:hypothetical protein